LRIPSLIDMEVTPTAQDAWQVRIAMTRVPGEPLSHYIESHRPGHIRDRIERHRRFGDAAVLARELVMQLAPAFERIATRAYHRDVTPRNILVDYIDGEGPRFGLIDFGLAVDATQ
jgi:tRNA A-37 threonylcarbamoyl transferase component Bud32